MPQTVSAVACSGQDRDGFLILDPTKGTRTVWNMASKPDLHTYEGWCTWKERRQRRNNNLETVANVLAGQAFIVAVMAQFWRGKLSGYSWSDTGVKASIGVSLLLGVVLLISPERGVAWLKKVLNGAGAFILGKITFLLLTVLYVMMWPVSRSVGRRRYLRMHPTSSPWVTETNWRVGTWSAKHSEAEEGVRQRGTLARLVWYFLERGNILILVIVAVLLVAVSLSILAHTPYLAPFVYTIF